MPSRKTAVATKQKSKKKKSKLSSRFSWLRLSILFVVMALVAAVGVARLPRTKAAASNITKVVVIFQENHTFDNVLGYMCATETRTEPCDGTTSGSTKVPVSKTNSTGSQAIPLTQATDIVPSVGHDPNSQKTAIDGGKMDGFNKVNGCGPSASPPYACYTQYHPDQVPNLSSLARSYTITDRFFSECTAESAVAHIDLGDAGKGSQLSQGTCSANFSGANPTHFSGNGNQGGCTSKLTAGWVDPASGAKTAQRICVPLQNGSIPDPKIGTVTTPVPWEDNLFSQLSRNNVSWKEYSSLQRWDTCRYFAECIYTQNQAKNIVGTQSILTDAANGTLPTYSLLVPDGDPNPGDINETSQHNGSSMLYGDNWIGQVVSAIQNGPDWQHTAIVITYDDCGCFYDHVAPPASTTWGLRMPTVIVSPWARPNWTDHTPASFASLVHLIDNVAGLSPLNDRAASAYDLSGSFNFAQTPLAKTSLKQNTIPAASATYLKAHPAQNDPSLDSFESGAAH
ncbi:MAG: rane associated phosphoesterase [Candidatus Saccharibacteria bacterium]|nr:rane associated phosphoesterase [Candidatus Saccharibacteria bacterium]